MELKIEYLTHKTVYTSLFAKAIEYASRIPILHPGIPEHSNMAAFRGEDDVEEMLYLLILFVVNIGFECVLYMLFDDLFYLLLNGVYCVTRTYLCVDLWRFMLGFIALPCIVIKFGMA